MISLTSGGWLTGTAYMYVGSRRDSKSGWFEALAVRNVTTISIESYQDLQLQKQTNFLENANLQHNAQIEYAEAQTEYNNGLVTVLTLVIIGFMMIDIGVSLYDVSKKK
jgi:hypothetical protein